jgi:hypothetical protein
MSVGQNPIIHDIVIAYLNNADLTARPELYARKYIEAYKQIEEHFDALEKEEGADLGWNIDTN